MTAPYAPTACSDCGGVLLKVGYHPLIYRPSGDCFPDALRLAVTTCPKCDMLDRWPREKT